MKIQFIVAQKATPKHKSFTNYVFIYKIILVDYIFQER